MCNTTPLSSLTIKDLFASWLSIFVTFAANDCGYSGSFNEISLLEGMGDWDVIDCKNNMNIINRTWAFICKQFTYRTVKKFKVSIRVCNDQQMEEIDFFETYCTVAKLTKACMMFIFKTLINMKLKSKQSDVTITFLHSTLVEDETDCV